MTNDFSSLVVDVRANTQGFAGDIQQMRSSFDSIVTNGFSRAGSTLGAGLVGAIKRGTVGFGDLRSAALGVINDITGQAVRSGLGTLGIGGGGASASGSTALGLASLVGSLFGSPGRATGGPVSPGRPFVVGENGPELFVPTSAGQVVAGGSNTRNVNVSIKITAPTGASAPESLTRSSRQIAQSVRRALADY